MAENFADHRDSSEEVHDRVINHVFGCGLTLAGIVGRPDVNDEVAGLLQGVTDELDLAVGALRHAAFIALDRRLRRARRRARARDDRRSGRRTG